MEEQNQLILDIRNTNVDTKSVVEDIAYKIIDGQVNGAYAGVVLKKMSKISEEVMKNPQVKKIITDETIKYINGAEKGSEIFGAKILHCATSTNYDFKDCGHKVLNELYNILENVKEEIKGIEEELKLMIPTKGTMETLDGKFGIKDTSKEVVISKMPELVWESDDDIIRITPPIKYQGMGLKYMKI